MRKMLATAAAAVLIPSAALAEEKDKPGVVESLGAAAGGALGYTAGAAGGPLGSAVGGLVGQKVGQGVIGGVKKLFGADEEETTEAKAAEGLAPATVAELSPPQPVGDAPATLEELEAAGGPPLPAANAGAAGVSASAEAVELPQADPAPLTGPDAAALDYAPPEDVPTP
jgi:hypothetical protein